MAFTFIILFSNHHEQEIKKFSYDTGTQDGRSQGTLEGKRNER